MKECRAKEGFFSFNSWGEFNQWFQKIADSDKNPLNDDLCIEGNSGLKLHGVKEWIGYFGIENVYFELDSFEHGYLDTFYFDLRNALHKGRIDFQRADEITMQDGFLRLWFD